MRDNDDSASTGSPGETPSAPPAIPGHQLLRRIARGSYGEVWLARNDLGEHRAVKIVRRDSFDNPRPYDRELAGLRRYEPVSREHEGLVDVLQVGCDDASGYFYYVMELADDVSAEFGTRNAESNSALRTPHSYTPKTLAHEIRRRGRLPVSAVIELGIALCRALEFLHARRLIHRDIKPANIIFVGGQPKLADVGLIAHLDATFTRGDMGTTGYIAPEGANTEQADLYSLGKVLYEAATGKAHYEFPDLPTKLGESNDDRALIELNEVLLKACESRLRNRYRHAKAVTADLERLMAGCSLRARRTRLRRMRVLSTVSAVVGLVATAGVGWHFVTRPLFVDEFERDEINTNFWHTDYHHAGTLSQGYRKVEILQTNGCLSLRSLTSHEDGNSTFAFGWVEFKPNLRQFAPCSVELEVAGSACRGRLAVAFSRGIRPTNGDGSDAGIRLAGFFAADVNRTNEWGRERLRFDLLSAAETAVVWPDGIDSDHVEIVDLSSLRMWRLRFYCDSFSSRDYGAGMAEFRISKVKISHLNEQQLIVGRISEKISSWPIAGAEIRGNSGKILATSGTNGSFVIRRSRDATLLMVTKTGYTNTENKQLSTEEIRPFVEVQLHKQDSKFGDPVDVISFPNLLMYSIGFVGDKLMSLIHVTNTQGSLIPVDLSARRLDLDSTNVMQFHYGYDETPIDFAPCGQRLIGMRHSHGEFLSLNTTSPVSLIRLTNSSDGARISWPQGMVFDGEYLWFGECDEPRNRYGVHAFDMNRLAIVHSAFSPDRQIAGLAWDGKQIYFSDRAGRVAIADRELLMRTNSIEAAITREFRGSYDKLAFRDGFLWALDQPNHRIFKLKATD